MKRRDGEGARPRGSGGRAQEQWQRQWHRTATALEKKGVCGMIGVESDDLHLGDQGTIREEYLPSTGIGNAELISNHSQWDLSTARAYSEKKEGEP